MECQDPTPGTWVEEVWKQSPRYGILGFAWSRLQIEERLSLSYPKKYIYMLLLLIEDANNREHMNWLITIKRFPFMYNGMSDANPPPGHDIDKFVPNQTVAVQFQIHLLNFWMPKDPKAKFGYIFRMVSLYLVQLAERHDFSMPSKRKRGLDKWIVTPPRTRNAARVINLLE